MRFITYFVLSYTFLYLQDTQRAPHCSCTIMVLFTIQVDSPPLPFVANSPWKKSWVAGGKVEKKWLDLRFQHFCSFTLKGSMIFNTTVCENEQLYKWQAGKLVLPLGECYILVCKGDQAYLWHKITSLPSSRTELNAAPGLNSCPLYFCVLDFRTR